MGSNTHLQELCAGSSDGHISDASLAVVVVGLVFLSLLVVQYVHSLAELVGNADQSVDSILDHVHEVVMWRPHAERGPCATRRVLLPVRDDLAPVKVLPGDRHEVVSLTHCHERGKVHQAGVVEADDLRVRVLDCIVVDLLCE